MAAATLDKRPWSCPPSAYQAWMTSGCTWRSVAARGGRHWVGGLHSVGLGRWLRLQPLHRVRSGRLERRILFGRLGRDGGSFSGLPHGVDCALRWPAASMA
jgi:hypothetical protein